ncbi:uncharacterized protein LOC133179921 [Saccostrea echinata]|uniref:uncharacterized protein LOC133179921 n=1 Tax=Saccostrea echinata TaxID=191078 RepID=UPI002A7F5AFA|nr:uncharacterized protein LOC133179921 [Saccostrea echinata]
MTLDSMNAPHYWKFKVGRRLSVDDDGDGTLGKANFAYLDIDGNANTIAVRRKQNRRSFSDFEELWVKMGEELERSAFPSRYIPPPPSPNYHSTLSTIGKENESLKRPLSPTPESQGNCGTFAPVASYSPALDSNCSAFAPVTSNSDNDKGRFSQVEDSILTTLRRTNPNKMCKLEKRMKEQSKQDVLEQVEVLKTVLARVTLDCEQIKIILNFIEDKLSKVDSCTSAKRVKFTTL